MKIKRYYGLKIDLRKIENYNHVFLPEDFDFPCYKIFLEDPEGDQLERCEYSINVFINDQTEIVKIERDEDIYLTNYNPNRLPIFYEKVAGKILNDISSI